MGEKDIVEKTLESYNDVFADIVNGLLFNGEQVIKEDELEAESEHSMYKADDKLHEQERDVAKYWRNGEIRIALYGLENQTVVDPDMPLRVFSYDGAAYRNQLNQDGKTKRYPVITLVLYFGDAEWNKPKNLLGCLDVPEKLKPFVNDYRINLFEICKLSDEQISNFKSDFKIVADYFAKRKKIPDYRGTKDAINHVDEFFKLMKVLTNDSKFESVYNEGISGEKGGVNMCDFLDTVEARGEAKIIQGLINTGNMTVEQIADMLKLPAEKVKELAEMTLASA
ncbi:MAG: Rpn family recombination-promoting nuclease/putative transposase [Treponemataceae bacterium]|nr:Rpn family recombination-promoting nuclease/putative transposase [Treponemataceae bacterium]